MEPQSILVRKESVMPLADMGSKHPVKRGEH